MSESHGEKECQKCHGVFPATIGYFVADAARNDGLYPWCKTCKNHGGMEERLCPVCGALFLGWKHRKGEKGQTCSRRCFFLRKASEMDWKCGMLTILDVADDVVKIINGERYVYAQYKVQCECGTLRTFAATELTRWKKAKTASCGCNHKKMLHKGMAGHGENHHGYTDGHTIGFNKRYKWLYKPEHPNAVSDGRILEHLYVMSEFLGRRIRTETGEEVHHRNGLKHDNRIENLELWTKSQPAGQRVEDMVTFCGSYLKLYRADARKLAALQAPHDPMSQLSLLTGELGGASILTEQGAFYAATSC